MATVFPSYVPSTPSTSSQSSLPPSYAISVHDHVLPQGWTCKYDPKSGKYYFLNDHLAHQWITDNIKHGQQSSSQSSRTSSPSHTFTSYGRYFQPFSSRYKVADSSFQKIAQQFPHVEDSYINHLMKIYHNREHLVVSALISEGHTRTIFTPPDEALYYKLKNYFPTVESETIRQLLSKHNNTEHEVIGAIISTLGPNHGRYQSKSVHPGSPKMKLRYLKLIYPEADEAVLFDLLYNCDQNAQDVINRLEGMGYRKSESCRPTSAKVTDSSVSSNLSEMTKALRPQSAPIAFKQSRFPPNCAEKQNLFKQLEEAFPTVNRTLLNMALESSGFNAERAKIFLAAMTPQDSAKYFPKDFKMTEASPTLSRFCRGTQTNSILDIISGTPIKTAKGTAKTVTIGTSTTEDGIIIEEKKKALDKGADPSLRKGPNIFNLIKSYLPWKGSDSKLKRGADPNNRKGPDPSLKSSGGYIPKGPQPSNRKGPLISRLMKRNK